jgi:hypothetical protein
MNWGIPLDLLISFRLGVEVHNSDKHSSLQAFLHLKLLKVLLCKNPWVIVEKKSLSLTLTSILAFTGIKLITKLNSFYSTDPGNTD